MGILIQFINSAPGPVYSESNEAHGKLIKTPWCHQPIFLEIGDNEHVNKHFGKKCLKI